MSELLKRRSPTGDPTGGPVPKSPFGLHGDASMWFTADDSLTRSAEHLVQTVCDKVCHSLGATASSIKLVKSLVWPFIARRSKRKVWFTDKEFGRMINSFRSTAKNILYYTNSENREQSFIKFHLDTLMCQVFRDSQRPTRDDWNTRPLFSGWTRRYVARRLAARDLSFIYSLAKGSKQMWPSLGIHKECEALNKHSFRFSTARKLVDDDLTDMIHAVSKKIFAPILKGRVEYKKFVPSGSACLQHSRRKGGALRLSDPALHASKVAHEQKIGLGRAATYCIEKYRREQFEKFYDKVCDGVNPDPDGYSRNLRLKMVTIPEPGKFRVISIGDGYLYSALQPLQGVMLDCWKKNYASTMKLEDLTERVREIEKMSSFELWNSGDWEAATDWICKESTWSAFRCLRDTPFGDLGYYSLGTYQASYPMLYDWDSRKAFVKAEGIDVRVKKALGIPIHKKIGRGRCKPGSTEDLYFLAETAEVAIRLEELGRSKTEFLIRPPQEIDAVEGQPMGHPLSFPLLCIINLAVYHTALQRWAGQDKELLKQLPVLRRAVLVNGDDVLFKCDSRLHSIWKEVSESTGFKISQGKSYLSSDTCMINSQVFQRRNGLMTRFGYLNLRIVTGHSQKTGDSRATAPEIATELNKMVSLCDWTACAIPATMNRWKKSFPGHVTPNWYLPVHLGGYGVNPRFGPRSWRVTQHQRKLAAQFIAEPAKSGLFGVQFDMKRKGLERFPRGFVANWKLIPGEYVERIGEEYEVIDDWTARLNLLNYYQQPADVSIQTTGRPAPREPKLLKLGYRLKPMSLERIFEYWFVRFVAHNTPVCPPLGTIRTRSMPLLRRPGPQMRSHVTERVDYGTRVPIPPSVQRMVDPRVRIKLRSSDVLRDLSDIIKVEEDQERGRSEEEIYQEIIDGWRFPIRKLGKTLSDVSDGVTDILREHGPAMALNALSALPVAASSLYTIWSLKELLSLMIYNPMELIGRNENFVLRNSPLEYFSDSPENIV